MTSCTQCGRPVGPSYFTYHNDMADTDKVYCIDCVVWSAENGEKWDR